MRAIGLDIGGANLKIADATGWAKSIPFALWKQPDGLQDRLRTLLHNLPTHDVLAVTMTGELCDCFATKREGIFHILDAVTTAAPNAIVRVWQTDGRFVSTETARERVLQTAAANWHALATFAAGFADATSAVLIDIGSTTTDIIPLHDGKPVPQGKTDTDRLATGELVYTGVGRTPICAVASQLKINGIPHRIAAEFFATMRDVYLITGDVADDPQSTDTADGRPNTAEHAAARLARMICADLETLSQPQVNNLAHQVITTQEAQIRDALRQVLSRQSPSLGPPTATFIISGQGEFLAGRIARQALGPDLRLVSFAERFGPDASNAACAFALAKLASKERLADDL
jgi:hypothetical protein